MSHASIWRAFVRCAVTAAEGALEHLPTAESEKRHGLDVALSLLRAALEDGAPVLPAGVEGGEGACEECGERFPVARMRGGFCFDCWEVTGVQ